MTSVDDRVTRVERAVREHAPGVLAYFARRVESGHDAADLLAETFLVVWRRAASMPQANDEVRPWMFGIARRVLLHHYRSTTRKRALSDRLRSMLSATPHPGFSGDADHDDLRRAIAALDQVDRDIIGLVHWEGFTLVEASRILKMKEGTVRSRYHRAKAALRDRLEHDVRQLEQGASAGARMPTATATR